MIMANYDFLVNPEKCWRNNADCRRFVIVLRCGEASAAANFVFVIEPKAKIPVMNIADGYRLQDYQARRLGSR